MVCYLTFQVILGFYVKRDYMSIVGPIPVSLRLQSSVWTMRTATDVTAYPAGQVGVNSRAIIVHCIFTCVKVFSSEYRVLRLILYRKSVSKFCIGQIFE